MKYYKIICSDDINKPIDKWTILIELNEQNSSIFCGIKTYEFKELSPPTKFIRLVMTGPTFADSNYLSFYHLDFFGKYFYLNKFAFLFFLISKFDFLFYIFFIVFNTCKSFIYA